jgi:NTP pyrophosphatase (non-canonical NTP hydrolase)
MEKHKSKPERHAEICGELNAIYRRKNADYGDSFGETFRKLGIISAITRITDKVNRLQSLSKKTAQVQDESIRDTLYDLANYAIMAVIEMEVQT